MNKFDICMKYADKWQENGKWFVSNEFICGTFAGRSFDGDTLQEAIQKLIDYFNKESQVNMYTIVKNCLHNVGWFADVDDINENLFIKAEEIE